MDGEEHNPRAVEGGETPLVGHVVVVGFHAKLGSRIEFSYPRLRGSVVLRTPRLNDTQDVAADIGSGDEKVVQSQTSGDWGYLPPAWSFLPLMALPDGAHDSEDDTAYFCLPPHVHCVACFRQTSSSDAVNFNAGGEDADDSVAARGSVQKSVVLLCKRPIYGVLGDRLGGVVRAYFDQGDFSQTDVLAKLFHSINASLCRPSLNDLQVLVHGLDLRSLVRSLKGDILRVIKLIMLEKRVVFISQPVKYACNAVASLASVFPAAFDRMSPSMKPLDRSPEDEACGLPLELLAEGDRVTFQPHAPLPSINHILNDAKQGCLIGTSRNCGYLLKTAMSGDSSPTTPRVDAVVDVHTGQMTLNRELEAECALTRDEKLFAADLVEAASHGAGSSSGALEYVFSDDYIRTRLREYLRRFLGSVASVEGVLVPGDIDPAAEAPPVMDPTKGDRIDWSPVASYNDLFARHWVLRTKNGRIWARRCQPQTAQVRGPPAPQLQARSSDIKQDLAWFFGDTLASRIVGGLAPFSSTQAVEKVTQASNRAYEGVSGLFQRLETELKSIETAILEKAGQNNFGSSNVSETLNLDALVTSDSNDITNMRTPIATKPLPPGGGSEVSQMPSLSPSIYEKPNP